MRCIIHVWAGTSSLSEATKRTGVRRPQGVPKVLEDRHNFKSAHNDDEYPTINTIIGSMLRHTIIHCSTHKRYKMDDQRGLEQCMQHKMRLSWWILAERSILVHANIVQSATIYMTGST